ncbi:WD40 repeat domain-containing protein [Bythopirellula goksoeyrii]|uniref:Beta-propeller repeat protein n=1 Tax=Bythopirellula goksoeyrii TaxID=1400387 RepID=A0A5B9QH04_9BACT|nr:hypothetical protein [Bythopirellula goksoeyrii]QEG33581.1 hypothetical protein Pr1d_08450 [Bythopirellula goksoeyrii]
MILRSCLFSKSFRCLAPSACALLLVFGSNDALFAIGNLLHTFDDPTVTTSDSFGWSVAIDGDYALVGARRDDTHGTNVGQAHLFDISTGNLLHTFDNPTVGAELFGNSVAIAGDYVLIGTIQNLSSSDAPQGQAHLFDAVTGNLLHTFDDPTVTSSDLFGFSVAIDGHYVLIGDHRDDTNGVDSGQAHLFDAVTGNLLRTFDDPVVNPNGWGGDLFGFSVAIDGDNVLIGAAQDLEDRDVGQARLFDAVTGNLLHTFEAPTANLSTAFGTSVAIDGNYVLVGAPEDSTNGSRAGRAHLFDAVTGILLHTFNDPTPSTFDYFGESVAIDGNHVLIGTSGDDTNGRFVGQVHLFDAVTGNLLHTFNDPTITTSDSFGWSVAIEGDNVLIGAIQDDTTGANIGQAHLFTLVEDPLPDGDFNGDGIVDGHDFLAWQRNPSIGDLADWQANYDANGSVDNLVTIPEPACGLLLILGATVSIGRHGSELKNRSR